MDLGNLIFVGDASEHAQLFRPRLSVAEVTAQYKSVLDFSSGKTEDCHFLKLFSLFIPSLASLSLVLSLVKMPLSKPSLRSVLVTLPNSVVHNFNLPESATGMDCLEMVCNRSIYLVLCCFYLLRYVHSSG